ncbi:LytR/AlgR family response regulator transcription factor [Pseudomarimonas arenosa]|uniref:LytTR family transcriptional regulator n=1 Tax=Pseudomarimonas arenosa TaxID=2774145 RepID=A0AAW3ZPN9_9GAMM|nr:LytTR family DNA-binding domain-containing protein [Pseudomarimonas arenosa]MBD8528153.1 LytTR family transcriptional regulator [Pseudomarimonas arenosa]
MSLQHYLHYRRYYEVALWVLYATVNLMANTQVAWTEVQRIGQGTEWWEVLTWEASSTATILLLLPLLLVFDARFSLERDSWRRHVVAHLVATLPFSLAHVGAMYLIRQAVYLVVGETYQWQNWWQQFGYEFLKDFRTYFGLLAIIYLYRFTLRRLQGEAEFLSEGREEAEPVAVTDRFLVKKLGREFLVRVEDIDWIEASGNYVNLHVGLRAYPLRETMTAIEQRLAGRGFARVHRSAMVNLDRVREIVPFDTGDGEARLISDVRVAVSRRYRKRLREQLG